MSKTDKQILDQLVDWLRDTSSDGTIKVIFPDSGVYLYNDTRLFCLELPKGCPDRG